MLRYVIRRVLIMIPTLIAISFMVFAIIRLPEGDYLSTYIDELQSQGETVDQTKVEYLRHQYGLDLPFIAQYARWAWGLVQGDLGYSFEYDRPVVQVIGDRLLLSAVLAIATMLFTYAVAFPVGVFCATHRNRWSDHLLTSLAFIGIATPNFILALLLLYASSAWFGISVGGLFDAAYLDKPWSWGKLGSLGAHLIVPVLVIGASGTGAMVRRLRANLLDELGKPYVVTARAKGMKEGRALVKYPLRMALNPFIADIGNLLPSIVSGSVIVSIVLSLDTTGKMLLGALQSRDMYLAGSFLMFLALLTVVGVLISDLLLAALDPRIRLDGGRTR
jgi:peptide/nickel transport system permease protein